MKNLITIILLIIFVMPVIVYAVDDGEDHCECGCSIPTYCDSCDEWHYPSCDCGDDCGEDDDNDNDDNSIQDISEPEPEPELEQEPEPDFHEPEPEFIPDSGDAPPAYDHGGGHEEYIPSAVAAVNNPRTGDGTVIILLVLIVALAGTVFITIKKRVVKIYEY